APRAQCADGAEAGEARSRPTGAARAAGSRVVRRGESLQGTDRDVARPGRCRSELGRAGEDRHRAWSGRGGEEPYGKDGGRGGGALGASVDPGPPGSTPDGRRGDESGRKTGRAHRAALGSTRRVLSGVPRD